MTHPNTTQHLNFTYQAQIRSKLLLDSPKPTYYSGIWCKGVELWCPPLVQCSETYTTELQEIEDGTCFQAFALGNAVKNFWSKLYPFSLPIQRSVQCWILLVNLPIRTPVSLSNLPIVTQPVKPTSLSFFFFFFQKISHPSSRLTYPSSNLPNHQLSNLYSCPPIRSCVLTGQTGDGTQCCQVSDTLDVPSVLNQSACLYFGPVSIKSLLSLRPIYYSRVWCIGIDLCPFLSQSGAYTIELRGTERKVTYSLFALVPL